MGSTSPGNSGHPVLLRLTKAPPDLNALLAKLKLLQLFAAPPKWGAFPAQQHS